jgi:predicted transposase/invertase (TIGR01784 family)
MRLSKPVVIRFINALFRKNYSLDSTLEYLSTENLSQTLNLWISDVVILINHRDKYIIEAQMSGDENMALRLFTYSYEEALKTRRNEGNKIKIKLVPVMVIYLDPVIKPPPDLALEVTDIAGAVHEFRFPTMRLFDYPVAELERNDLGLLLPFYLLKLRKAVREAGHDGRRELSGEVKRLLEELIEAAERSETEGRMSKSDMRTVLWLMGMLYGKLYKVYEEFKETTMVIDEMLMTAVDKAEIEGEARGREEGEARGREEGIRAILDLLAQGKSIEEAKKILGVEGLRHSPLQ